MLRKLLCWMGFHEIWGIIQEWKFTGQSPFMTTTDDNKWYMVTKKVCRHCNKKF